MAGVWFQNGQTGRFSSVHRSFGRSEFTIYVDNLPNSCGTPWFRLVFSQYSFIDETYLPNRRSKRTGNRFGFVRYRNRRDAKSAVAMANGLLFGSRSIIVEMARYDSGFKRGDSTRFGSGSQNHEISRVPNEISRVPNAKIPHIQDDFRAPRGKPKSIPVPQNHFRTESCQIPNMGNLKELERKVTLNFQPTASGWLMTSAVAKLKEITTMEMLQQALEDLDFQDVSAKSLGEKKALDKPNLAELEAKEDVIISNATAQEAEESIVGESLANNNQPIGNKEQEVMHNQCVISNPDVQTMLQNVTNEAAAGPSMRSSITLGEYSFSSSEIRSVSQDHIYSRFRQRFWFVLSGVNVKEKESFALYMPMLRDSCLNVEVHGEAATTTPPPCVNPPEFFREKIETPHLNVTAKIVCTPCGTLATVSEKSANMILYCLYIAVASAVGERKESKGQRSDADSTLIWLSSLVV
ncbi:hypothetical protein RHSIM_Rhsim10G0189500 [Rhododendron simsii]|uniref:RRM domain-containing protein n=1 Tax=Rhododendron simsii TaxID=118357 RepID=A0A834GGE8_RHOSS|nr:hypothetical protein RHSIM_Rhsim10G0189500 [Rhododendron simsii]